MSSIAVITGASSGIGRSFVEALLSSSDCPEKVWIVARRADRLEQMCELSDKVVPVVADLSKPDGVASVIEKVRSENASVRYLINSAGMGKRGKIADRPSKDISDVITLNCTALSVLTRDLIPFMSEGSRIINIASTAAFMPQPDFAVYSASKSYVIFFGRALARELKKTGITVTTVCPGPVNTEFNSLATDGATSEFKGFRKLFVADAAKLSKASLKAARRGRNLYVHGLSQKAFHFASKIIPTGLFLKILY
ncbi:MAG: SDR family NAD(P)-dependent oxidoreductase [Clostridiales bacterium]|nr:SDR family NAD(P)-dependent oxidoreductase [Clostridiales bacterium]